MEILNNYVYTHTRTVQCYLKAMFNERGQKITEAGPATPVSLLGFEGAPNAGDKFNVFEDEKEANR